MTVTVEYPLITRDAILDGMVAALGVLLPAEGDGVSADRPLYSAARYMGELTSKDAFERGGLAGRCPAVRCAFVSDRSVRTTIGRRVDYVEGTFVAVVFSDSQRSKDDRQVLLRLNERVQAALGARRLGLEIKPLLHRQTTQFPGIEHCTAYGVTFVTRYRVAYVKDPGNDHMESVSGSVFVPPADAGEDQGGGVLGQVDITFEENP
jgi:hypothetical protein